MSDESSSEIQATVSVASRVLAAFVDAVAEDTELCEVAERLRVALVERGNFTEATLRQALLGDAEL